MKRIASFVAALAFIVAAGVAFAQTPPKPGPRDLCPVCGMLVSKYPHWVATAVWKDGRVVYFDGAKDLFKYVLNTATYEKDRKREEIASITVTEFYDLKPLDARRAWYVIGSDVLGPMGHELVPLASRADAEDFVKDHKGRRIVRFDDVTAQLLAQVDAAKF
jgi:copper chaperone NosL